MSSFTAARALSRVGRTSAVNQTRRYAAKAIDHPPGYVPTAEEWIAQRAAVQAHAEGTTSIWPFVAQISRPYNVFHCF